MSRYEADLDLSTGTDKCNCYDLHQAALRGAIIKTEEFRPAAGDERARLATTTIIRQQRAAINGMSRPAEIPAFGTGYIEQIGRTATIRCET